MVASPPQGLHGAEVGVRGIEPRMKHGWNTDRTKGFGPPWAGHRPPSPVAWRGMVGGSHSTKRGPRPRARGLGEILPFDPRIHHDPDPPPRPACSPPARRSLRLPVRSPAVPPTA